MCVAEGTLGAPQSGAFRPALAVRLRWPQARIMPAQGHFPGAAGPSPAPGYSLRGLKPASRCSLALAAGQDYRPKGRFSGRSKPLDPQPALEDGGNNKVRYVCCVENGRKEKAAPEIRDRSHTARIQASLILADVFYRYTAARYLATVNRRHFRRFMLFQTKKRVSSGAINAVRQQSTSFKGRAAKQTEHREAMTKQDGKRQIKLA